MWFNHPILLDCNGTYDTTVWKSLEDYIENVPVNVQQCGVDELGTSTKVRKSSYDFVKGCLQGNMIGYMKQQNVQNIAPKLLETRAFPSFILNTGWEQELLLWVGSPGSKTGLHRDPQDSVLMQFKGTKRVHVLNPSYKQYLYENKQYDTGSTDCCIDLDLVLSQDAEHLTKYPQARAIKVDEISTYTIQESHALFIPKGWYHQVETIGDEASISVNAFIIDFTGYFFFERIRRLIRWMHNKGWIYKNQCQCHLDTIKMC